MEDYGDLYNDITLRRTVSGRHVKSGSAESVNEDDFEVTRSVYEQSVQQQQQPHHPRRRSKKAWAAIIATALVAIGAIGYCTHELMLSRSAIRSSQATSITSDNTEPTFFPTFYPTISPVSAIVEDVTVNSKSQKDPPPANTEPNKSKESAQSGDGPGPANTKPNKSKESKPSEDTPPVAPIEPDNNKPTLKPTTAASIEGTVTVSTETTGPPTVASRSDEPV